MDQREPNLVSPPKRTRDLNQARRMADIATGEVEDRAPTPEEEARNSCYSSSVDWCAEL
jgi:hypothetical protein